MVTMGVNDHFLTLMTYINVKKERYSDCFTDDHNNCGTNGHIDSITTERRDYDTNSQSESIYIKKKVCLFYMHSLPVIASVTKLSMALP